VAVEVFHTDEFAAWYLDLGAAEQEAVDNVVEKLELMGFRLGFPHSSDIKDSSEPIRELRPKGGASPLRAFYAFDPGRDAILLLGGDKSGDPRFYARIVPRVERIWREYLVERRGRKGRE
jgi:hypothetical protein